MTNQPLPPYSAEELMDKAAMEAARCNIPESLRDDAIQEYVIAALEAGQRGGDNPRGYQYLRGRGAMVEFCRQEARAARAVPPGCAAGASRLSFDASVEGMEGDLTTLADVIPDENAVIPGEEPPEPVDYEHVRNVLADMTPDVREAAMRVLSNGEAQEDAAAGMEISRGKLRRLLRRAKKRIEAKFPHGV